MEALLQVPNLTSRKQLFSVQLGLSTADTRDTGVCSSPAFATRERGLSGGGGGQSDSSVAGLSHDVRNMLAALYVYCDLLSQPAVLTPAYQHYANDLRLVAQAGSSLLERLSKLATPPPSAWVPSPRPATRMINREHDNQTPDSQGEDADAIQNLATELKGCCNLLAAFAGPLIRVELDSACYTGPVPLSVEDLTRILINLVRNASEVMPSGGAIRIAAFRHASGEDATTESVVLSVEDDGPGIAASHLPHVFERGYTTKGLGRGSASWTVPELHGLGLAIVRGLVESSGGTVRASSPAGRGARFEITVPVAPVPRNTGLPRKV